jgi:hypothetical protein
MKLYTYPASPVCRPIAMLIADHGMEVDQQVVDLMAGEQNLGAIRQHRIMRIVAITAFETASRQRAHSL